MGVTQGCPITDVLCLCDLNLLSVSGYSLLTARMVSFGLWFASPVCPVLWRWTLSAHAHENVMCSTQAHVFYSAVPNHSSEDWMWEENTKWESIPNHLARHPDSTEVKIQVHTIAMNLQDVFRIKKKKQKTKKKTKTKKNTYTQKPYLFRTQ